nr:LacI family DNA-binding transcriptional regulator [uncultured Undibacterium sp.]
MATIREVAQLAGVGVGTVSRVLSGKGPVSPETLERVQAAIAELNFRPSHAAQSLSNGNSQMIGVYFPLLEGEFLMPILRNVDSKLRSVGLHMVVAFGLGRGNLREQALEGIDFLIGRGCDGLVVYSDALLDSDLEGLGPTKSRLVILNHCYESIPDQCFSANHFEAGRMAAQALLQLGHRKIAVIAGPSSAFDNVYRINGFIKELESASIDTSKMWIAESDFSHEGGWAGAGELISSGYEFTALFCANDLMASGALSFLNKMGIKVPQQVSVISYDDTLIAAFSSPRLTSVHIGWEGVTNNAVNHLLNICYGRSEVVERDFTVGVTWRDSIAKSTSLSRTKVKSK